VDHCPREVSFQFTVFSYPDSVEEKKKEIPKQRTGSLKIPGSPLLSAEAEKLKRFGDDA